MASSDSGEKMTNLRRISLTQPKTLTIFCLQLSPERLSSPMGYLAMSAGISFRLAWLAGTTGFCCATIKYLPKIRFRRRSTERK
jgi:hypothetical protein